MNLGKRLGRDKFLRYKAVGFVPCRPGDKGCPATCFLELTITSSNVTSGIDNAFAHELQTATLRQIEKVIVRTGCNRRIAGQGIRVLLSCVVSFIIGFPAAAGEVPFQPGERLTFVLKWGVIPAGEAVMSVLPMAEIDGEPAYHYALSAKSNAFVDVFYKVRDHIDAYADTDLQHSLLFRKKQREGGYKRDVAVTFDWEKSQARYSRKDGRSKSIDLLPATFDPLSAFYFIRTMDMQAGSRLSHPITDGKKNVIGEARVIRREIIEVAGKSYDTLLIVPDLRHIGGVFKKSRDAKIQVWVTADNRHIPVRLKSKVVVGSFVGELVSSEGLK